MGLLACLGCWGLLNVIPIVAVLGIFVVSVLGGLDQPGEFFVIQIVVIIVLVVLIPKVDIVVAEILVKDGEVIIIVTGGLNVFLHTQKMAPKVRGGSKRQDATMVN